MLGHCERGFSLKKKTVEVDYEYLRKLEDLAVTGLACEVVEHDNSADFNQLLSGIRMLDKNSAAYHRIYGAAARLNTQYALLARMQLNSSGLRSTVEGAVLARHAMSWCSTYYTSSNIKVTVTDALKAVQWPDTKLIYSVVIYLLRNAIKWTRDAERKEIVLDFIDDCVVVSDSGPGVAEEDRDKLFTPFSSTCADRGMGLFICQRALKCWLGERISYSDKGPLSGATFLVKVSGVEKVAAKS